MTSIMHEELIMVPMETVVENFLVSKVRAYVAIDGKIYAYICSKYMGGLI
jgi:hypothetical protein